MPLTRPPDKRGRPRRGGRRRQHADRKDPRRGTGLPVRVRERAVANEREARRTRTTLPAQPHKPSNPTSTAVGRRGAGTPRHHRPCARTRKGHAPIPTPTCSPPRSGDPIGGGVSTVTSESRTRLPTTRNERMAPATRRPPHQGETARVRGTAKPSAETSQITESHLDSRHARQAWHDTSPRASRSVSAAQRAPWRSRDTTDSRAAAPPKGFSAAGSTVADLQAAPRVPTCSRNATRATR